MNTIVELWSSNIDFSLGQSIALGLLFLLLGLFFYVMNWYSQRDAIIEFAYPKVSMKTLRRRFDKLKFWDKVFLFSLRKNAKRKGFMLHLCWLINVGNLFSGSLTLVGFIGLLVSKGSGWSLILLLFLPFGFMLFSAFIRFVPDLIWLPSERKRYF